MVLARVSPRLIALGVVVALGAGSGRVRRGRG